MADAAAGPIPSKGELSPNMAAWKKAYEPGPFTEEEFNQFWTHGYIIKRGLIPLEEITPAVDAVAKLVDTVARKLLAAGKIKDLCENVPFEKRLIEIEKQFPNASVLLHKLGTLPLGIAHLWGGPTLLSCARQLLGYDLKGHPVWNLRTKTPQNEQTTVPWHQDTAYLQHEAVDVCQLTAWVPLVDANKTNGCMEVISHGHRAGREVKHECCVGGTWYVQIADGELEKIGAEDPKDIVLCEVAKGDVLFLNNVIPHRSLSNVSDHIRWSLDLRWQKTTESVCFYGLKEGLLMSKADDPTFKPDWSEWAEDDRQLKQMEVVMSDPAIAAEIAKAVALEAPMQTGMASVGAGGAGAAVAAADTTATTTSTTTTGGSSDVAGDPFDTIIAGPWMQRWNIVHHNKHVNRYEENKAKGIGSDWHAHTQGGAFG